MRHFVMIDQRKFPETRPINVFSDQYSLHAVALFQAFYTAQLTLVSQVPSSKDKFERIQKHNINKCVLQVVLVLLRS